MNQWNCFLLNSFSHTVSSSTSLYNFLNMPFNLTLQFYIPSIFAVFSFHMFLLNLLLRFWKIRYLHHTGQAQSLHYCRQLTDLPVDLLFHFPLRTWLRGNWTSPLQDLLHASSFPAESHGLRFGGAASHPGDFTLSCKLIKWELEVTKWWSIQDYIVCKDQTPDPEITKPDSLNPLSARRYSVHKGYEQSQWKKSSLGGV